jgi:uncharacterized protein YqeY
MSLKETIKAELKTAMKEKDVFKRDTLRLLTSAMKQIEVDERKELSDDEVMAIIQKQVKQRKESIEQYKSGGRDDLAEQEEKEMAIFESYLPKQLSDLELEEKLKEIIAKAEATTKQQIGKVMGIASKELKGLANGKRINSTAMKLLS